MAEDEPSEAPDGESTAALLREIGRVDDGVAGSKARVERGMGSRLGRFVLRSELGRGGMGVVYRAHDESLGRAVALKVLPAGREGDREWRGRFLREARSAAAVIHPNVATIYEIGETDGSLFIAMELVSGESLRAAFVAGRPLPSAEVVRIAKGIARGLAAAHAQGIVHRDLKPENVMCDVGGEPKILDFGLAKLRDAGNAPREILEQQSTAAMSTEQGRLMGTPSYMSPEQAAGKLLDARSDLFSLGIVLYEALTGGRPFVGDTSFETIAAVMRDVPAPLRTVNPDVPASLAALVMKCLAKAPGDRPASANELLAALEALASPAVPAPALPRWPLAAAVVVAIVGGTLGFRARSSPDQAAHSEPLLPPLAAPDSVLACPILEASGTVEPGWLGAAAADYACRRATWLLGGRLERTRPPAELLGLPHVPGPDFPEDPYVDPSARARTLDAAKKVDARLEGRIDRLGLTYALHLELRAADGRTVGAADATAPSFHDVVDRAVDDLARAGAIPRAGKLDPAIAKWMTHDDVDGAAYYERMSMFASVVEPAIQCAGHEKYVATTGAMGRVIATLCTQASRVLDTSSVGALVWTVDTAPPSAAPELVSKLQQARDEEPTALGRASLALAVATLFTAVTPDYAKAEALIRAAAVDNPRDPAVWEGMVGAELAAHGEQRTTFRAARAWLPAAASSWAIGGEVRYYRRAFELMSNSRLLAMWFAIKSADTMQTEELRSLSSTFSGASNDNRRTAEWVLVCLDMTEVRFGRALARLETMIDVAFVDDSSTATIEAGMKLVDAASLGPSTADRWLARLDVDRWMPPDGMFQIVNNQAKALVQLALRGSPARGLPVLEMLRRHVTEPMLVALVEGAQHRLRGDVRRAAASWRPLVTTYLADMIDPEVFFRTGATETVHRLEDDQVAHHRFFGGVSRWHPAAARHAVGRGDLARGKELAKEVVDAWSTADIEIPALVEMRAILARK